MIDRDKLKEEFNQLRLEQSNISSRIKHINWALSSTTDQLAELYLRNDIILSTKTTIKGIVHVLFDLKVIKYIWQKEDQYIMVYLD